MLHCSIVALYHWSIAPLFDCSIVSLLPCYIATLLHFHIVTLLQFHCSIVPFSFVPLLHFKKVTLLHCYSSIVPLLHFYIVTVTLFHCSIVLLFHCYIVALFHCSIATLGVFDWAIGHELIFRSSHFLIRLVPVTKQLHDRGYFVLTGQKGPVTQRAPLYFGHVIYYKWEIPMFFQGLYSCFYPESCISIFYDVAVVETKLLYQSLKILRLFPGPYLGLAVEQSIIIVALFDLPAAWELRQASENGDQKPRFGHCLGLYISIQGVYCNVKCATSVYFCGIHVYPIKTLPIERFRPEFFKL